MLEPVHPAAGWPRLAAAVADEVVVTAVQDVHRAVSDGVFRWLGPVGRPIQRMTDAANAAVYRSVRLGLRGAGEIGEVVARRGAAGAASPVASPSRAVLKARAIAHGVVAEDLLTVAPELQEEMTLRWPGRPGPVLPAQLPLVVPHTGSRLVVFVHGLVDTEQVWIPTDRAAPLPTAADAAGATPLLVRYGTGRSVVRNGRDLDSLLGEIIAAWPVPVTSLTLVGHSMGGLLLRVACAAAAERGARWLERLDDVVYLGTPHLGSWLEKVANVTSWTLRRVSSRAAPFGTLLDLRSQGIKDLRFGTTDAAAWPVERIDEFLTGRPVDVPWLEGVRHHLVVGRLRPTPRHPLNAVLGDALVRSSSASGAGRWRRIEGAPSPLVTTVAASHTRLPRDAEVAQLLTGVLAAA